MTNSTKRESILALYNQEKQRKKTYHFSLEDITKMFDDNDLFWVLTSGNFVYYDGKVYRYDHNVFDCYGNIRDNFTGKNAGALSEYELHRIAGKAEFSLMNEFQVRLQDWYTQLSEPVQQKLTSMLSKLRLASWKPMAHRWTVTFNDPPIHKIQKKIEIGSDVQYAIGQFHMYENELKGIPITFSKALKYHMEQRGVSNADLSKLLNVSPVQISYLVNESEDEVVRHTPKMIVAICVALNLSPTISLHLLELAGCSLLNNRKERVYRYIVDFLYNQSLDFVDEFLIANEMQPLRKQD